jgi:uncharacterized protein YqjF (DUF2071 family)
MGHVEPITATSPRPVRRVVFTQAWLDLAFVHWALDPDVVAPMLPAGVHPDVLDGVTPVGLVAFRMHGVGIGPSPGIPYFGSFAETNVRLYTVDDAGRRGVFFLSLDATRLVPVLVARALGVPYRWARMSVTDAGDTHTYVCRRRWPGPGGVTSRLVVRSGEPVAAPSELERFVSARWGLHLSGRTGTAYWPNEHPRWPLHRAELVELDDGLVGAAGLPRPVGAPTSVLWSPGVRVRFGPKRSVPGVR